MNDSTLFEGEVVDPGAPTPAEPGMARFQRPVRDQVMLMPSHLDSLLPLDHRARFVWDYVKQMDLSAFYDRIKAVEGHGGRPPIDPAILMSLWLYATLENVGSARAVERLCEEHDGFRWICGGVHVNHHTLSDFRSRSVEELDGILSDTVAVMMKEGFVDLQRVTQDGVRVRAEAGSASFRRGGALKGLLRTARRHVRRLKEELHDDSAASSRRVAAAKERAAAEHAERIARALKARKQIAAAREKERREESAKNARASTTDPDARLMKMADGGFRPAYNGQFAADTKSGVIVGVSVTNQGNDVGQLPGMVEQIERRYGRRPREMLVDTGFVRHEDVARVGAHGTVIYAPVTTHTNDKRAPHEPHPQDDPVVAEWRRRMGTRRAQAVYRERGPTAEWVNAQARNHGLRRVFVRGLERVRAIFLWFALAHNLLRAAALRRGAAAVA